MKNVFLSIVFITIVLSVRAQTNNANPKRVSLGAGVVFGIPVGDLSPYYSLAEGVDMLLGYSVNSTLTVNFSAGFVRFDHLGSKEGLSGTGVLIPLLFGIRYSLTNKLFLGGQIGGSISSVHNRGIGFTYCPSLGYKISKKIDLQFEYQSTRNDISTSFLGIRGGFTF